MATNFSLFQSMTTPAIINIERVNIYGQSYDGTGQPTDYRIIYADDNVFFFVTQTEQEIADKITTPEFVSNQNFVTLSLKFFNSVPYFTAAKVKVSEIAFFEYIEDINGDKTAVAFTMTNGKRYETNNTYAQVISILFS